MHLAEAERRGQPGLEREDLIDWYLETRETDLQTVEELEEERELIGKALHKLVKVCSFTRPSTSLNLVITLLNARCSYRINTFWKSKGISASSASYRRMLAKQRWTPIRFRT